MMVMGNGDNGPTGSMIVSEITRVLQPGGKAYVTGPRGAGGAFSSETIAAMKSAGFTINATGTAARFQKPF
jgi:hypothetical protein